MNHKRYTAPELLIFGAMFTGLYFVTESIREARRQHPSENGVVVTYDVKKQELMDNTTGKIYAVGQEIERNRVDNLDYQVRTGRLVLEEIK